MEIQVITLFPDEFMRLVDLGVTGRAIREKSVDLSVLNPRDFARDRHRTVDDRPYGGGPGMVMAVEPLRSAIRHARGLAQRNCDESPDVLVSLLSPQGKQVDQRVIRSLLERKQMILVCGRYEGLDERLVDLEIDEEWSIGDYVLSGGELAAAVVIDALVRLIPGVLGDEQSAEQDSFTAGLLDHPHYTRPEAVDGLSVPAVLLSGDHQAIARWRRKQALGRTWQRRKDLMDRSMLSKEDELLLVEFLTEYNGCQGN